MGVDMTRETSLGAAAGVPGAVMIVQGGGFGSSSLHVLGYLPPAVFLLTRLPLASFLPSPPLPLPPPDLATVGVVAVRILALAAPLVLVNITAAAPAGVPAVPEGRNKGERR